MEEESKYQIDIEEVQKLVKKIKNLVTSDIKTIEVFHALTTLIILTSQFLEIEKDDLLKYISDTWQLNDQKNKDLGKGEVFRIKI